MNARHIAAIAIAPVQTACGLWLIRGFIEWDIAWVNHMGSLEAETRGVLLFIWACSAFFAGAINYAIAEGGK